MRWTIIFMTILLVFAACEHQAEPTGQIEIDNRTVMITQDDISLTISTDKVNYDTGEQIKIHSIIENKGESDIIFIRNTPCDPDINVFAQVDYENISLEEEDYEPKVCIQMIDNRKLIPGQILTRDTIWDQMIPTTPDKIQSPSGTYKIITSFPYEIDGKETKIAARNTINLIGEDQIIYDKEWAMKIASENKDVLDWFNAHDPKQLIDIEGDKYYCKSSQERIPDDDAKRLINKVPITTVGFENNNWIITFFMEEDTCIPQPYQISVLIDSKEGKILNTK